MTANINNINSIDKKTGLKNNKIKMVMLFDKIFTWRINLFSSNALRNISGFNSLEIKFNINKKPREKKFSKKKIIIIESIIIVIILKVIKNEK